MIKLCWRSYECALTPKASKEFKKETGEDLSFTLSLISERWGDTVGMSDRHRLNNIYSACDTELAVYAIYALATGGGCKIPLEEIEDGVRRVGVFPNNVDDEWTAPWPLVLVLAAQEVERDFIEGIPKKKPGTAG